MFITELYKQSKIMFLCFSAFVVCFLVINYKWGAVATPVLHYGMYSGKYYVTDTITFYSINVNGKPLNASSLTVGEYDKLQNSIDQYVSYEQKNKMVYTTMHPYFHRLHLMDFSHGNPFIVAVSTKDYYQWVKNKIEDVIGQPVAEFAATRQSLRWNGTILQPVGTGIKIIF